MSKYSQGYTWKIFIGLMIALMVVLGGCDPEEEPDPTATPTEEPDPTTEPTEVPDPTAVPTEEPTPDETGAETLPGPVVILIVDDFGNNYLPLIETIASGLEATYEEIRNTYPGLLPKDLDEAIVDDINEAAKTQFESSSTDTTELIRELLGADIEEDNCAVNPEGTAYHEGGTAYHEGGTAYHEGGTGGPGGSHGERVERQFIEMMEEHDEFASDITLERIDTDGFTTQVIVDRIKTRVSAISNDDPATHIVINMSFALIPCAELDTYLQYQALLSLIDPEKADEYAYFSAVFQSLVKKTTVFTAPLNANDPLNELCTDDYRVYDKGGEDFHCVTEGSGTLVGVAAAGNASAEFPFNPAAFDWVTSISASGDDKGFIADPNLIAAYSNWGIVLMPGTWQDPNGREEAGTTFAAPRYSFAQALRLVGAPGDEVGCPADLDIPEPVLPEDWKSNPPPPANTPLC